MPIYKGTSEIASGNFYKGSANIENGYKENNSFYVNTLTFALDFLVVGGGGDTLAYGGIYENPRAGAGAGGFRTSYGSVSGGGASSEPSLSITTGIVYDVIVGSSNCKFHTITSLKGGPGNANSASAYGGSGGGGWRSGGGPTTSGGAGTAGQGYAGGSTTGNLRWAQGGGGGASAVGVDGLEYSYGGAGGAGLQATILSNSQAASAGIGSGSGSAVVSGNYFSGGGAGQSTYSDNGEHMGGYGIGGGGGTTSGSNYRLATSFPNSGGGGAIFWDGVTSNTTYGYGATGVVVVRYPNTVTATLSNLTEASNSPITDGSDKITIIKAGTGTITFESA
jgi:hypothetical protein|tara:strand:+ start:98 stop:1105 length:1008 start_codon:yes stop_codon:yes gene_type:complete